MEERLKELVKERKKLCNGLFFSKVMGYTLSWVNQAEHGLVSVSDKFIEEYALALEKVKKIIKN